MDIPITNYKHNPQNCQIAANQISMTTPDHIEIRTRHFHNGLLFGTTINYNNSIKLFLIETTADANGNMSVGTPTFYNFAKEPNVLLVLNQSDQTRLHTLKIHVTTLIINNIIESKPRLKRRFQEYLRIYQINNQIDPENSTKQQITLWSIILGTQPQNFPDLQQHFQREVGHIVNFIPIKTNNQGQNQVILSRHQTNKIFQLQFTPKATATIQTKTKLTKKRTATAKSTRYNPLDKRTPSNNITTVDEQPTIKRHINLANFLSMIELYQPATPSFHSNLTTETKDNISSESNAVLTLTNQNINNSSIDESQTNFNLTSPKTQKTEDFIRSKTDFSTSSKDSFLTFNENPDFHFLDQDIEIDEQPVQHLNSITDELYDLWLAHSPHANHANN